MLKTFFTLIALSISLTQTSLARDFIIAGQDYPPYNWEENKVVTGGFTDVMKDVCSDLKYNCKFQILVLARALKMLEDGEIDAVMSLIPNADRAVYSNFSPMINLTNMVYMANQNSKIPVMKDVNQLAGHSAAAVRGSSSLKIAQKHAQSVKDFAVKEEVDNSSLVQRLNNNVYGPKGLIIGSEDVLQYFAKKEKANLETVFKIDEQNYMVAFSKKKVTAEELASINKSIETKKKNGTVKKILAKYGLRDAT